VADKTILIRGGRVLTMDPGLGDLDPGDVLLDGGRIAAVGPSLDVTADEVVDARGMLVHPGLVDTHIHLWQTPLRGLASHCFGMEYFPTIHPLSQRYRPEDMYAATYAGALELLAHGVTTVLDFNHSLHSPEHADAAVDGLEEAAIRAIFGYSLRDRPELEDRTLRSVADRMRDARRVRDERCGGGRLGMALALNNLEHVSPEDNAAEVRCARDLGVLATVHSIRPGQVRAAHERGLLSDDLQWVHLSAVTDAELDLLAEHGGPLSITPETEAAMMSVWPVTGRALRRGVTVGLGVDVVSSVNGDVAAQARSALALDRMSDAQAQWLQGHEPVRAPGSPVLDPRRTLELVTSEAARSIGLGDTCGSLTPGKAADVVVRAIPPWGPPAADLATHLLLHSTRADVRTVIVDGEVRVSDGELAGVDGARVRALLDAAREHVVTPEVAAVAG
jgi:cytosine/adenosine deaminase-related metal-dependent hydrolase